MSILNRSHTRALADTINTLQELLRRTTSSSKRDRIRHNIRKLNTIRTELYALISEPKFPEVSNLDTAGELPIRERLDVENYTRKELKFVGTTYASR